MKLFLAIIILVISYGLSAQNLANLDKKFGINKFKLESDYSEYKSDLEYDMSSSDGVKYYKYRRSSEISIFNEPVSKVSLGFYKSKLYTISIEFESYDNDRMLKVRDKIQELFGFGFYGDSDSDYPFKYQWSHLWKTKKTYLGLNKASCLSEYKACICNLYMISLEMKEKIQLDSF